MRDRTTQDIWNEIRALREGGHVKRCHALVHNDVGYTDGKHSYDALSLLLMLHPDPQMHLVKWVLWHDAAERWVGDLPASIKEKDRRLRAAYVAAEEEAMATHLPSVLEAWTQLSDSDRAWAAGVDMVEFYLWCEDQHALGNRHVENARINILAYIQAAQTAGHLPAALWEFVNRRGGAKWRRLPEK